MLKRSTTYCESDKVLQIICSKHVHSKNKQIKLEKQKKIDKTVQFLFKIDPAPVLPVCVCGNGLSPVWFAIT